MFAASRARSIASSVVLSGSFACATTQPTSFPLDDPGPMARNWRLPEQIIEGYTGTTLDEDELLRILRPARVVYVAERHDRAPDHAVQLAVLAGLYRQDPSLALGVEMLPRSKQAMVDAYVRGDYDEEAFLAHVDWERTWGFDFALYRPLFAFARERGIRIIALNARPELTRAVARNGLEGLEPALAEELPEMDLDHQKHRDYVRRAFGLTDESGEEVHPGFVFESFYEAQVVWDETMAETVARTLTSTAGPRRMVVIAGSGHVEFRFGIPDRAARRGAEPFRTVLPVLYDELDESVDQLVESSIADFIWLMSEDEPLPEPVLARRRAGPEPR